MTFLALLGMFMVFYILRYFLDSDYKNTNKKRIVFDTIITSILAFVIQFAIRFILN